MTVLEASNHLYSWFSDNSSFSIEKDFIKVISITETPTRDRAAFLCALKNFKKNNFISSSEVDEVEYWVLEKNFNQYPQTVSISPELALTLSTIINQFCETVGNDTDICDPASVQEEDIKNLIYIANLLVSERKLDPVSEE